MRYHLPAAWVCLLLVTGCVQTTKPTKNPVTQAPAAVIAPVKTAIAITPSPKPTQTAGWTQIAPTAQPSPSRPDRTATQTADSNLNLDGLVLEKTFQYNPWALVHDLAWSADGTWLAISAGENIFIYDGLTLEAEHSLSIGTWAKEIQFLRSQHTASWILGLAASDGKLQFWDIALEKQLAVFKAHNKAANSLAISPDREFAASSGNDAILRLWNLEAVWTQPEGEISPTAEMIGGAFAVPAVRFSPDGSLLASIDLQAVRLRDPVTTRLVRTLRSEDSLFDIAFSPDGQYLAAASMGSSIQVWQVETGKTVGIWKTGQEDAFLWSLAFDAIGSRICAASSLGAVYVWSFPDGELLSDVQIHKKSASTVGFSPDGKWMASGGLDAVVHIWALDP